MNVCEVYMEQATEKVMCVGEGRGGSFAPQSENRYKPTVVKKVFAAHSSLQ